MEEKREASLLIFAGVASLAFTVVATELTYYFGLDPKGFTLVLNSSNFSILGASSALGVPSALLHSPGNIVAAISYQFQNKTLFMIEILAPLAFLPIFFPEAFVMALPWIGTAFLSNYEGYYTIYGFHQAFIIFFVFPAAILGLKRLKAKTPRIDIRGLNAYLAVLLVIALVASNAWAFPAAVYGKSFTVTKQNQAEDQVLSLLPANASVLTTSDIFPHVASRLDAYTIPPATLRPQYEATDGQILSNIDPQYIMLNMGSVDGNIINETDAILSAKVYNGSYGLVAYSDKVILLKENYVGPPILYDNAPQYNSTNLVYDNRWTSAGPNDSLFFAPGTNHGNMWFGPYVFFPSGNYTAVFTLRISSPVPQNATVIRIDVDYGNVVTVSRQVLIGADFPNTGWQTFRLNFDLKEPVFDIQFRGVFPTNATGIYLSGISVVQS